jgi:transcriptional regulator with XRE-family HTH domain
MNQHETDVFSAALERLQIKTIDAPRIFGVTRQTLSNWMRGNTKVPKAAFITLLELENNTAARLRERLDAISETARRVNAGDFDTLKTNPPKQGRPRRK